MTLRSPKKRPTTAQTFIRRIKTNARIVAHRSAAVVTISCAAIAASDLAAQMPTTGQSAVADQNTAANPGWNLRWRKSTKVTPQPVHIPEQDVFAKPARRALPKTHQQHAAATTVTPEPSVNKVTVAFATDSPRLVASASANANQAIGSPQPVPQAVPAQRPTTSRVAQVGYRQTQGIVARSAFTAPIQRTQFTQPIPSNQTTSNPSQVASSPNGSPARIAQANELFNNPFAQQQPPRQQQQARSTHAVAQAVPRSGQAEMVLTQAQSTDGFQLPGSTDAPNQLDSNALPSNTLRGAENDSANPLNAPTIGEPSFGEGTRQLPAPAMQLPGGDDDESMRSLLADPSEQIGTEPSDTNALNEVQDAPAASNQAPANQPGTNPIGSPSDLIRPESDLMGPEQVPPGEMTFESPFDEQRARQAEENQQGPGFGANETSMLRPNELSCEEFRGRIARETIDRISLDPSPPFRPDLFDPKKYQEKRELFEKQQATRPWRNLDGEVIATGRFVDLAYEQAIVETADGGRAEVPVNELSEGDLGYLAENWGLPKECLIEQVAYTPRSWTPLTMTWKASNICSKPRYFEEVNLERYGHTAGPILQPVVSSAHFFANIAVLPYKMGVHPPGECQYALGYYRPGNCAPWIIPPVPISARGALAQGAAMTGAFWLIP